MAQAAVLAAAGASTARAPAGNPAVARQDQPFEVIGFPRSLDNDQIAFSQIPAQESGGGVEVLEGKQPIAKLGAPLLEQQPGQGGW